MKQKKKMEFSKKIYIFNIIFVVFVVIVSMSIIVLSGELNLTDLSPLTVICTSAFGELAVHSGFYASKAKAENILKIGKQISREKSENNIDEQDYMIATKIMGNDWSDV